MTHFFLHLLRSKLAVLPEEGQLSRRESMNESNKDSNGYIQIPHRRSKSNNPDDHESAQSECGLMTSFDEVPQSGNVYTSLRARKMALRRKRSLSVADLPVRNNQHHHHGKMAEESGYDSDVTRKSSPRGSLKNCGSENSSSSKTNNDSSDSSNKDTDSVSSGSDDSAMKVIEQKKEKKEPVIKKPPRKSKLPEPVNKSSSPLNGRRFKKNGEENNNAADHNSGPPSLSNSDSASSSNTANNLPSLTSKRFKMLRLKKDVSGELGIIISKKRHPQKGTTGYIIAHVEPGGLVER